MVTTAAKVLNRYIKRMRDIPFVSTGDLEAECMDPDNKQFVVLQFFV